MTVKSGICKLFRKKSVTGWDIAGVVGFFIYIALSIVCYVNKSSDFFNVFSYIPYNPFDFMCMVNVAIITSFIVILILRIVLKLIFICFKLFIIIHKYLSKTVIECDIQENGSEKHD